MEMTIPGFSGFYDSIWSGVGDCESDNLAYEGFKHAYDWHWSEQGLNDVVDQYAEEYLDLVNRTLGLHLSKNGKASIDSPREYNFRTDEIWFDVDLLVEDTDRIIALMKEHRDELRKIIREHHTSCDGFISFMSNDVDEWINHELFLSEGKVQYLSCVVHYLLDIFGEGDYDGHFFECWGYESMWQAMEYEDSLNEEYEKYNAVTDIFEKFDGEKWDEVSVAECKRLCRLKKFEKEH